MTVHLPDAVTGPTTVLFAWPGGGYGRRYFDIRTVPGYSQAAFHTGAGAVLVSCDHIGVGDSTVPDSLLSLTFEQLAAANHATALAVLDRLRSGELEPGVPPVEVRAVMGNGPIDGRMPSHRAAGQPPHFRWWPFSDGAGSTRTSLLQTAAGSPIRCRPEGSDLVPIADKLLGSVAPSEEHYRFCFHYPDEDPALAEPDLESYRPYSGITRGDERTPWGSATTPPCAITMMTEGSVAAEAASIDVPVFVGCGERDTVPDPGAELTAYRGSVDITISVNPGMSHMHNFARSRLQLWRRLAAFATALEPGTGTKSA